MRTEPFAVAARRPRPLHLVASRDERGFSLIVALMMLIVIIILGVSASQMAINEERGARNDRDRQLAFQAAEAALKDAELEIYGAGSPLCTVVNEVNKGRMRPGTTTCFNATNRNGYVVGCSAPPNAGLCYGEGTTVIPAYLDSANVDFYKDATGAGNNHTVAYGTYTNRTFPSQVTLGATTAVSSYPPRYIIETVTKNTSYDTVTEGSGGSHMFRVTAMGFGANPNSQVVLQVVVATQD